MRLLLLISVLALLSSVSPSKEGCSAPEEDEDCESITTQYEKYVQCLERRSKRSTSCNDYDYDECSNCNCNSCDNQNSCGNNCNSNSCGNNCNSNNCGNNCNSNNCGNNCNSNSNSNNCCSRCCQSQSSCSTYNCCHQSCRAQCRSSSCRTSCKRQCKDTLDSNSTVENSVKLSADHNITTVIHLNNVINNTNIITFPINVNNTNINNITVEIEESNEESSNPGKLSERCCLTIGPRQCVSQKEFPFVKCFHIRKKACGYICTAPVVHYEKHEICDNNVKSQQPCQQQVIFVPQPQPRCAYQESWPYVGCGGGGAPPTCEGCYSHYIARENLNRCSSYCYDDGFGVGPLYRQAPFYRPGYAHAPSCLQTGLCNEGFGGYGQYNYNGFNGAVYPPESYPFSVVDGGNFQYELPPKIGAGETPIEEGNYSKFFYPKSDSNVDNKYSQIIIEAEDKETKSTTPPTESIGLS